MDSSSFPGSSKRAKAPGSNTHCLVDGCNADLGLCRDYHRRHKVCETHSKTAKVTIGGREQRFCQQCSRFHSLVEFDEGKRSCRKRLDGHNRRRRKPQPDSLSRSSGLNFSTSPAIDSARILSFGSQQQILPSAVVSSSWAGVAEVDGNQMLYNNQRQLNYIERQNSLPQCSAHSYEGVVNQLPCLQGRDCSFQETSICQPFLDPNTALGSSNSNQKMFCDGFKQVVDSDRALSLLSSAPSITLEFCLNHVDHSEPLPQPHSLVHNLHYSGLTHFGFGQESKPIESVTESRGSNASTLHFSKTIQHAPEGSSTSGSHQTRTFMWE